MAKKADVIPKPTLDLALQVQAVPLTWPDWRRQNLFIRPPGPHSAVQSVVVDAKLASPLAQGQCCVVKRQATISVCVVGLFDAGCPSAIARFVRAIVVDPIQRVTRRWPWPHVPIERFEAFPPFDADRDSSRPVVFMTRLARVQATPPHPSPGLVFGGTCHAVGGQLRGRSVGTKATTRANVPNVRPIDIPGRSAVALTGVAAVSTSLSYFTKNNHPAIPLADGREGVWSGHGRPRSECPIIPRPLECLRPEWARLRLAGGLGWAVSRPGPRDRLGPPKVTNRDDASAEDECLDVEVPA